MIVIRQTLLKSDIQLSYLEWKQGKEPLLLLHGLGDHALVWSSLGDYLAADYHIVAPDMRGHGESSKPTKDYSFESAIADLEALMDHLGSAFCSYCQSLVDRQISCYLGKAKSRTFAKHDSGRSDFHLEDAQLSESNFSNVVSLLAFS